MSSSNGSAVETAATIVAGTVLGCAVAYAFLDMSERDWFDRSEDLTVGEVPLAVLRYASQETPTFHVRDYIGDDPVAAIEYRGNLSVVVDADVLDAADVTRAELADVILYNTCDIVERVEVSSRELVSAEQEEA